MKSRKLLAVYVICAMLALALALGLLELDARNARSHFPEPHDWIDRGVILRPGPPGSWDARLGGAITPCVVIKKDGTFFLYYIGADGDRSTDGGVRHRALGVATSPDGITFTKFKGNPILTHLPNNNEEEGIFSAGATLNERGEIVLYYGALDAGNRTSESVDSDIRLAVSSDGFNFVDHGDVISHADKNVWGNGDELFPLGTLRANGKWYVYYLAKGHNTHWDLGLASGPSAEYLPDTVEVLSWGSYVLGGANPIPLGNGEIGLLITRDFESYTLEARTARITSPQRLSRVIRRYKFNNTHHATAFLSADTNTWYLYYLNDRENWIGVKVAKTASKEPKLP